MVTRADMVRKGHIVYQSDWWAGKGTSKWTYGATRWPQRKPVEKPGFVNGARVKVVAK